MSSSCEVASSQSRYSLHTLSMNTPGSATTLTNDEASAPHHEPNPFMRTIYPDYSDHDVASEPHVLSQLVPPTVSAAVEPEDRVAAFQDAGVTNVGVVEYGGYVLGGRLRFRHFVVTRPPMKKIHVGDTLSLDGVDGRPVAFVTVTHVRAFEKKWVVLSFKRATDPPGVTSPWIPLTHMGDLTVPRDCCRLSFRVFLSRLISSCRMPDTIDVLLNKVVSSHTHMLGGAAHTDQDMHI